jgi:integrase
LKDIKQGFTDAVKKAGIEDFRFHDLRHCAIANMRRAGLDPFTIMKFTGHKTLKMVERYNTVERVDGEEALGRLNTHFAKGQQRQEIYSKSTASGGKAGKAGK